MASLLVDTDVLSFLEKGDTRGTLYRPHLAGQKVAVSFMTVAELDQWALLHNWGANRRSALESELQRYVLIADDRDLCRWWAAVRVGCRRAGRSLEVADAWIAATALYYGIPLVTHNPDHYAYVPGLTLISEAP